MASEPHPTTDTLIHLYNAKTFINVSIAIQAHLIVFFCFILFCQGWIWVEWDSRLVVEKKNLRWTGQTLLGLSDCIVPTGKVSSCLWDEPSEDSSQRNTLECSLNLSYMLMWVWHVEGLSTLPESLTERKPDSHRQNGKYEEREKQNSTFLEWCKQDTEVFLFSLKLVLMCVIHAVMMSLVRILIPFYEKDLHDQ